MSEKETATQETVAAQGRAIDAHERRLSALEMASRLKKLEVDASVRRALSGWRPSDTVLAGLSGAFLRGRPAEVARVTGDDGSGAIRGGPTRDLMAEGEAHARELCEGCHHARDWHGETPGGCGVKFQPSGAWCPCRVFEPAAQEPQAAEGVPWPASALRRVEVLQKRVLELEQDLAIVRRERAELLEAWYRAH